MNWHARPVAALAVVLLSGALLAADWPAHRHDFARSGVTEEQLATPLHRQWTHVPRHAPRPAWPEPGRELNRVAFDYVFHVSVANGMAFFGSSADHKACALDLATGRERWSFFTEGPVRFAPAVEAGRVFVASDDGWLYCLSAERGRLLWRFRGGPRDERLLGNEQMVSRWPLRAGVGVEKGIVYFAAGMWPAEGVHVYALRAADGQVLWENATSGADYLTQPHPGSFSMTGVAPQGYVLGHEGQVFVPTGRNVPAAYDRETGKLLYYRSQPAGWGNRWGGSWCFLAGGLLFNWRCHVGPDIDVRLGEFAPHRDDGIVAFNARTGKEIREFAGKLCAVVHGGTLYATGGGNLTAYGLGGWLKGAKPADCTKWETPHGRAYELILAGDTLFVGGQGAVTAVAASDGNVLWQDKVEGQARGLAVAQGRLLVSTTDGRITCYGPEAVAEPPAVATSGSTSPWRDDPPDSREAALARRILDETGRKAGFCLALGAGDGRLLYHLAKQSELTIYCVEPSERRAARVREALDAAGLYGPRVAVHVGDLDPRGYPDYFADLVIFGDGSSRRLMRCSAEEFYRVLRPCGGVAWLPAAEPSGSPLAAAVRWVGEIVSPGPYSSEAIQEWLREGGVPEDEVRASGSAVQVVRGKLPGADDWTHQFASAARTGASNDQRARLPLKLLWFGDPSPARLVARHWAGPAPLCVNGRMFTVGQYSLMAHDAYNGRELWRRDFAAVAWWPVHAKGSSAAADRDSVYLVQGKTCLRLDAATGETLHTYPMPDPPADISQGVAKGLRWSFLAVSDGRVLGGMGTDREAKALFLFAKDGKLLWTHTADRWIGHQAISVDRKRVYLIDRTSPADIDRAKRRGEAISSDWTLVALDADSGKAAWHTDQGVADRTELWLAEGVLVATSRTWMSGYEAATGKPLYVQEARSRHFPVIAGGTIYLEPFAYDLKTGEPRERANPFTGETTRWEFRRSYGCGSVSGGPNLLLFRSGTLGMYDLAGDAGVFNFGGVRAGCYVNAIAANGLVLCPPADAACTCSYSLRTTVALAPATIQRDRSIFYDHLPTSPVRRAAFDLGALGDRRDDTGALWLALPRPETRTHRTGTDVPFRFTFHDGFGPYRRSPERTPIDGTDRPWLYASGLKGLRRAELDLEILDPGFAVWPARQMPIVDGQATDPCWDGYQAIPVPAQNATVTLRHDWQCLYLLYQRPAGFATRSVGGGPWKAATTGEDARVWQDRSFELYLSEVPEGRGAASTRCLHLGLSASGARYDARWTYVTPSLPPLDIPRLDVTIDGDPRDWGDRGLTVTSLPGRRGKLRPPNDFDPSFRIGWNDTGLVLLAQVKDNVVQEWPNVAELWRGDGVEIFLASAAGTAECLQCVVSPGSGPAWKARSRFYDHRRTRPGQAPTLDTATRRTPDGYTLEILLPWRNLGIEPAAGRAVAMQLFANDIDDKAGRNAFQALWHQAGNPTRDALAYQPLRLAAQPSPPLAFKRGRQRGRDGLFTAAPPHPLPIDIPPLGAQPEDPRFAGLWWSAVRADDEALVAEVAIPWKTLAQAGLDRANLMLDVASRGPLQRPPALGQGYERLLLVPEEKAQPRTLSVRLHFAELDDVRRGERVFDVKLQGRVVLEGFDVVRAARGRGRAVVQQFDGVEAARALTVELVPKAGELTASTAPILSALEVTEAAAEPPSVGPTVQGGSVGSLPPRQTAIRPLRAGGTGR